MMQTREATELARCSSFGTDSGAHEYFLTITTKEGLGVSEALRQLHDEYTAVLKQNGLDGASLVFSRLHVSDSAGMKSEIVASPVYQELRGGALSIIEQPPLGCGPISALVYHAKSDSPLQRRSLHEDSCGWRNIVAIDGSHYRMLWTANLDGRHPDGPGEQTRELFGLHMGAMAEEDMSLLSNAVRTWVYVRDIDNNYAAMVDVRRELFEEHGLTRDTRYIASTGIQGNGPEAGTVVSMDALSVGGLEPEQIVRMEALDNLSPTIKYGVTFERGTRVRYGDRSHLYISGTASIDRDGNVMHVGDVARQTERTLDNVRALLQPHGASLVDMAYVTVYLRNAEDYAAVRAVMDREMPLSVPCLCMVGSVCRPTWLVEMEGIAVVADSTKYPAFL